MVRSRCRRIGGDFKFGQCGCLGCCLTMAPRAAMLRRRNMSLLSSSYITHLSHVTPFLWPATITTQPHLVPRHTLPRSPIQRPSLALGPRVGQWLGPNLAIPISSSSLTERRVFALVYRLRHTDFQSSSDVVELIYDHWIRKTRSIAQSFLVFALTCYV